MWQILRAVGRGGYQLFAGLFLALSAPWILWRRGGHYRETILPRLGRHRPQEPDGAASATAGPLGPVGPLWIHAVSVGEAGVAATLARALPEELSLLVTTITPTGQERARKAFRSAGLAKRSTVTYFPFDLGFAVRRFLDCFHPKALVLVEGDYWPVVLSAVRRRGLPVVAVNGRVSDRSFRRMQRLKPLLGPLFSPVDRFAMQTEDDARRLVELGVPEEKVHVTGNLKYETEEPAPLPELERWVARLAAGRPVLVAGSTMAGEEEQVIEAFSALGGGERALLILVPRHPERWDGVWQRLEASGFMAARRSHSHGSHEEDDADSPPPAVVLLDTLGELASLYRYAAAAFIGGTLVPTGGHNPLEPARFAIPTVVGPSMENFREMAAHFDSAGAWARASGAEQLGEIWRSWLDDPAAGAKVGRRGKGLIEANRGALAATLEVLAPVVGDLLRRNDPRRGRVGSP